MCCFYTLLSTDLCWRCVFKTQQRISKGTCRCSSIVRVRKRIQTEACSHVGPEWESTATKTNMIKSYEPAAEHLRFVLEYIPLRATVTNHSLKTHQISLIWSSFAGGILISEFKWLQKRKHSHRHKDKISTGKKNKLCVCSRNESHAESLEMQLCPLNCNLPPVVGA